MTRRNVLGAIGAAGMFPSLGAARMESPSSPVPPLPALQVSLRIDQPRSAAAGWRHADINGGMLAGRLLQGVVQSGQLRWLVDPASGAVEVLLRARLLRVDGVPFELHDRTVQGADHAALSALPGVRTAPRWFDASGELRSPLLAGWLDASGLARGEVILRAFDPR